VATSPDTSREVCGNVSLVFMNEAEYDGLYGHGPAPKALLILKRGPAGASLLADGLARDVNAAEAQVVDPTGGGEILAGVFLALHADGCRRSRAEIRGAGGCKLRGRIRGAWWPAPHRSARGHPWQGAAGTLRARRGLGAGSTRALAEIVGTLNKLGGQGRTTCCLQDGCSAY
jgi:sugar/nucleoside kinase (ribokinase family)